MSSSLLRVARSLRTSLALGICACALSSSAAAQGADPVFVTFDSVHPPTQQYMNRVLQHLPPVPEYVLGPRWSGQQGQPRNITWSLVPDGLIIPSAFGEPQAQSALFSVLDASYASQGGRATWVQRIQDSFDRWEELTGINFIRKNDGINDWDDGAAWGSASGPQRGDIRIAMKRIDLLGGITGYASFPATGDIVLDRAETWELAPNDNRYLRNFLMHEIGIAIGIDLVCPNDNTKLMELVVPMNFDGPQQDDIRAAQRHYGDPLEQDNSVNNPTVLGTLTTGVPVNLGDVPPPQVGSSDPNAALLSIDADGEHDFYSFDITGPVLGHVVVTPVGSTYQNGPTSGGGCGVTSAFNALTVANLDFQVIAPDGTTVVASGNTQPAGVAEDVSGIALGAAGTYYVRVFESNAPSEPQSYKISITISSCVIDGDGDGTADCLDGCPADPAKLAPGLCGCGVADTDSDGDGTPNCNDGCPNDPNKIAAGFCGCGVPETDTDGDGTPDCNDTCPTDPNKTSPGFCGCGLPETDTDGDGTPNCADLCPNDPGKIAPGICGCGVSDADSDGDGTPNCLDGCPNDPLKTAPGICGCGTSDIDTDGDGTVNCQDGCPSDPNKTAPGACGCGVADVDTDGDGTLDCLDGCPLDPNKIAPGICGCGLPDADTDGDGTFDCFDLCPTDPLKIVPGICGCGVVDIDTDGDGVYDCFDNCDSVQNFGQADADGDGVGDACDNCPNHVNPTQADCDGDNMGDVCEIALGNSVDCDANGVPDDCEPDCNNNGRVDACDISLGTSLDTNVNGVPDDCEAPCPAIQTYCTAKVNSLGCFPAIGYTGSPSASAGSGFLIKCTQAISGRFGVMFYGYGASFAPFQGGSLCVMPPFHRTPIQLAGGGAGCTGTYSFDFNVQIASGNDPQLIAGTNVFCRYWMRDPPSPFTTAFSNAITFTICP